MTRTEELEKLTETVRALTEAMVQNERRHQRWGQIFRWLGLAFTSMAVVIGVNWVAWAETTGQRETILQEFRDIRSILAQVDQMLKIAKPEDIKTIATDMKTIISNMASLTTMANHVVQQPETAEIAKNMAVLVQISSGMAQKIVQSPQVKKLAGEAVTLVSRLKQDSDITRAMIVKNYPRPPREVSYYEWQIAHSQDLLDRVPASPAVTLHEISSTVAGSLRDLVYSVDSTMGRMGRTWSWMPGP